MINYKALFKITYGLYIVCSGDRNRGNGYISNTVFQVSSDPALFAACCNKNNFTADLIIKAGVFSVSVLEQDASTEIIGKFGYKSGKDIDKLNGMQVRYGNSDVPVVLNESIAVLEFKLVRTVDVGTHFMFIGELINAEIIDESKDALTYLYYREERKGFSPKNAPTYLDKSRLEPKTTDPSLKRYKCPACGYVYDEAIESIRFNDLPTDWVCPLCGTEKSEFIEMQ